MCAACRARTERRDRDPQRLKHRSPEGRLRERLKGQYGITLEQYLHMLAAQAGGCAMCSAPPAEGRRLVVDHCHQSGRVRALLCGPCNTQLGAYEKLRDVAVTYLARYGAGNPLLNYGASPDDRRPAA
jgi:hypothetical protein